MKPPNTYSIYLSNKHAEILAEYRSKNDVTLGGILMAGVKALESRRGKTRTELEEIGFVFYDTVGEGRVSLSYPLRHENSSFIVELQDDSIVCCYFYDGEEHVKRNFDTIEEIESYIEGYMADYLQDS